MRRTRVLMSALFTLVPLLVFVVSLLVLIVSLISGSVSFLAIAGIATAIVWAASGVWRISSRRVHHG